MLCDSTFMDVFSETEIAGSLGDTARDHPFIQGSDKTFISGVWQRCREINWLEVIDELLWEGKQILWRTTALMHFRLKPWICLSFRLSNYSLACLSVFLFLSASASNHPSVCLPVYIVLVCLFSNMSASFSLKVSIDLFVSINLMSFCLVVSV